MAIEPTPEQVGALVQFGHQGPVQMINLLQFEPDGGRESYRRYAEAVQPHLERVGGRLVAAGEALQSIIGDEVRPWWDAIATVEYPSTAAFVDMVMNEDYQAIAHLRRDALARAELIVTAPGAFAG